MSDREPWVRLVRRFPRVDPAEEIAWRYGQTYRYLSENGLRVGSSDLWIASAAPSEGVPVVTRNAREFRRVPGLELVEY